MLEQWCKTGRHRPIELSGAWADQAQPEMLYGVISALMLRSAEMGSDIAEELEYLQFPLPDKPFRVAAFVLDDMRIRELEGRERHNCRLNMYAALRDYLIQNAPEDSNCLHMLLLGQLICTCFSDHTEALTALCEEAVSFARQELGFSAHVTVSMEERQIESFETAFKMIQDVESSRKFYSEYAGRIFVIPDNAILRITDHEQKMQFEQTFFQTADQICGCVRALNTELTAQYLREQLLKIAKNSQGLPWPTSFNLTINRFLSLMQYRLADQDLADWRYLAKLDFGRELISSSDMSEFLRKSERIASELVEHYRKRTQEEHDKLMHSIYSYVEKNATDINMGLASVAREFKIKPREAAESFRQYFGESVNDVMHKTRVKKARELLLTTDIPEQEIAGAVGYCSLATMYRAFTKLEGIAPGRLRQTKEN